MSGPAARVYQFLLSKLQPLTQERYALALEGFERMYGAEHKDTLATVNNLANLLQVNFTASVNVNLAKQFLHKASVRRECYSLAALD